MFYSLLVGLGSESGGYGGPPGRFGVVIVHGWGEDLVLWKHIDGAPAGGSHANNVR